MQIRKHALTLGIAAEIPKPVARGPNDIGAMGERKHWERLQNNKV